MTVFGVIALPLPRAARSARPCAGRAPRSALPSSSARPSPPPDRVSRAAPRRGLPSTTSGPMPVESRSASWPNFSSVSLGDLDLLLAVGGRRKYFDCHLLGDARRHASREIPFLVDHGE